MSHTAYDKDYNRDVIQEYQRLEQRNKIGLSTSKIRDQRDNDQITRDNEAKDFIEKNIRKKEFDGHNLKESPTDAFGKIRFVNWSILS